MKLETVEYLKTIETDDRFIKLSDKDLKDLQSELLNILIDFNEASKKHGLKYFLSGGTALGAVRHNGFIPWDDDVDLNITRENVPKLIEVYKKELEKKYYLHTPETRPDLGLGFIRLRKKGTILKTREDILNNECGIFIDLFIVENTYNNIFLRTIHGLLSYITGFLLSCRVFYRDRKLYNEISSKNLIFKFKITIGSLLSFVPVSFYTLQWNNVNKMCKNKNSFFVTIPSGRKHFFKEMYIRDDFIKTQPIMFEELRLPISKNYNSYLEKLYGDYMTIPKEKEKHIVLEMQLKTKNQNDRD